MHIVPFGKFHRIGGAPPEIFFCNFNYDALEEVGGDIIVQTLLLPFVLEGSAINIELHIFI